jgi:hypothetical protein
MSLRVHSCIPILPTLSPITWLTICLPAGARQLHLSISPESALPCAEKARTNYYKTPTRDKNYLNHKKSWYFIPHERFEYLFCSRQEYDVRRTPCTRTEENRFKQNSRKPTCTKNHTNIACLASGAAERSVRIRVRICSAACRRAACTSAGCTESRSACSAQKAALSATTC